MVAASDGVIIDFWWCQHRLLVEQSAALDSQLLVEDHYSQPRYPMVNTGDISGD